MSPISDVLDMIVKEEIYIFGFNEDMAKIQKKILNSTTCFKWFLSESMNVGGCGGTVKIQ